MWRFDNKKMDDLCCRIAEEQYIRDCAVLWFTEIWFIHSLHVLQMWWDALKCAVKLLGGGRLLLLSNRHGVQTSIFKQNYLQPTWNIWPFDAECSTYQENSASYWALFSPTRTKHWKSSVSKHENTRPDAAFIVLGVNHCNLKSVSPKYEQYSTFPYKRNNMLDKFTAISKRHTLQSPSLTLLNLTTSPILLQPLKLNWSGLWKWTDNTLAALRQLMWCLGWLQETSTNIQRMLTLDY